jgi:hypothetical protein
LHPGQFALTVIKEKKQRNHSYVVTVGMYQQLTALGYLLYQRFQTNVK